MHISIREIEYVLTVAKEESITKAAQKLYISQPALSQAILKIEATIGIPLFHRTKNGFSLTESGHIFARYGTEILKFSNEMETELLSINGSTQEKLAVGIPYYLSSQIMPPALHQFRIICPNVQVVLTELFSQDLEYELLQRKIDVAIFPLPIQSNGIACQELVSSSMCLLMSINDPLMQQTYTKPGSDNRFIDLSKQESASFIMLNNGQRTASVAKIMLRSAGINPNISFLTRNFNTLKRMVSNGLGVALVPEMYISKAEEKSLQIVRINLEEHQSFPWMLVAAYDESCQLSNATQRFIEVISHYFSENSGRLT